MTSQLWPDSKLQWVESEVFMPVARWVASAEHAEVYYWEHPELLNDGHPHVRRYGYPPGHTDRLRARTPRL